MISKIDIRYIDWSTITPSMPVATMTSNGLLDKKYAFFHPQMAWGNNTTFKLISGAGCFLVTCNTRVYIIRNGTTGSPSIRRLSNHKEELDDSFYYDKDNAILYMAAAEGTPMVTLLPLFFNSASGIVFEITEEDVTQFDKIKLVSDN